MFVVVPRFMIVDIKCHSFNKHAATTLVLLAIINFRRFPFQWSRLVRRRAFQLLNRQRDNPLVLKLSSLLIAPI